MSFNVQPSVSKKKKQKTYVTVSGLLMGTSALRAFWDATLIWLK